MLKKFTALFAILFATIATQADGASILGIDNITLLTSSDSVATTGNFLNYTSATAADTISSDQARADLSDSLYETYILSIDPTAYIDIAFTSTDIYNGAGNDLVFFFAGAVDDTPAHNVIIDFGLEINGTTINYTPEITPIETSVTDAFGTYTVTAALIDLDDFGLGFSSDVALGEFRVQLGLNDSTNIPALSLIGGFHTSPTAVVPLPLPIVLFASGLGMLGMFARKKS